MSGPQEFVCCTQSTRLPAHNRVIEQYTAKFTADTFLLTGRYVSPTDEALYEVLSRCVRPARPVEFPHIRATFHRLYPE